MKKIIVAVIVSLMFAIGCQQKEEPKQQFQPPIGQMPPGGIGGPGRAWTRRRSCRKPYRKTRKT